MLWDTPSLVASAPSPGSILTLRQVLHAFCPPKAFAFHDPPGVANSKATPGHTSQGQGQCQQVVGCYTSESTSTPRCESLH
ncbi:hypothetical protein AOLI_G00234930 [Acnodon oligacanthus]